MELTSWPIKRRFAAGYETVFLIIKRSSKPHGHQAIQAALLGINAAVVGLLLAALYQPVWTSAILKPQDFGLALVCLVALMFWKQPPWLVVVGGVAEWLLSVVL
ncbi:MAG: chromate transporter [Pseudomonas sp.]